MIKRAPVPQRCPTVPRAQVKATVPPCPTPYRGTGTGHTQRHTSEQRSVPPREG